MVPGRGTFVTVQRLRTLGSYNRRKDNRSSQALAIHADLTIFSVVGFVEYKMHLRTRSMILVLLASCIAGCVRGSVVSYETVQSFRPAQGSIAFGHSSGALNQATKLSEVRAKCGTPLQEWEETVPMFNPKLKHLKYKTYDPNKNILITVLTFVETSSDPPRFTLATTTQLTIKLQIGDTRCIPPRTEISPTKS